jgi:hypothetical protein
MVTSSGLSPSSGAGKGHPTAGPFILIVLHTFLKCETISAMKDGNLTAN